MSLEKKTLKELKSLAKKKQQIECPSYSKMTKSQLINYLSDYKTPVDSLSLTRQRLSSPKRVPQTDAIRQQQILKGLELEQKISPKRVPQTDAIRQQQILRGLELEKKLSPKKKRTSKKPMKKSSDPYGLNYVFNDKEKGYKQQKIYKKVSDPYYLDKVFKTPVKSKKRTVKKPKKISGTTDSLKNMRVVDLRKECKNQGLKTSGKKSELISRLRQKRNFNQARQQLNQTVKPKKSITSAEKRVAKQLQELL